MRTPKLNKAQNWANVLEAITAVVNNTNTLKKNQEGDMEAELINALSPLLAPKQGGGTSTKINAEGDVYCNYFEQYLPAADFNTKMGKPNKETGERIEGYKANCKEAEVILRKIKNTKANYNKQVMENFMDKTITASELELYLQNLEDAFSAEVHYETLYDVPTITMILNSHNDEEPAEEEEYEDLMELADEIEAME